MVAPERITTYQRDGLTFDVLDEGPLDGDVVVLLHGFPQLNTCWAGVSPLLNEAGYRTLAPNRRGYADGARPRGRRPYVVSELAADIAELIRLTGRPAHVVGHDWGAATAWATAMMHGPLVRTLTSLQVPHPGAFLGTMAKGQAVKSWYMGFFQLPFVPERLLGNRPLAQRVCREIGMTSEMFEHYWRDFGEHPARITGGLGAYRALPLTDPRTTRVKVTVPTTHVWSTDEQFLVRAGAERCGQYVDAPYRLEVLEGLDHWLPDKHPDEVARIVLARVRSVA
jgi:pimeloyl-ACP methyl ester carboxylesterase